MQEVRHLLEDIVMLEQHLLIVIWVDTMMRGHVNVYYHRHPLHMSTDLGAPVRQDTLQIMDAVLLWEHMPAVNSG